jgi:hypothetical protein
VLSGAGSVLMRRRQARHASRVDLYFDDGSMLSLADAAPEAQRVLPIAREVLSTAGPR